MEANLKAFEPFYGNMVLYSPGIDRVICLDQYDPFTAVESAQILSSKLPLVVGVTRSQDIDPVRSLEFSIKEKDLMFAFSSIFYSRQWPSFRRLSSGFEYLGWPVDYQDEPARGYLIQLKNYAEFVCRCVKATQITNLIFNVLPMQEIVGKYMDNNIPSVMNVPSDNTDSVRGISADILQILYDHDSVESATQAINELWKATPDVVLYRNQFYQLLGIQQPEDVRSVSFSGRITGFAV
jgi:hypothetical protein